MRGNAILRPVLRELRDVLAKLPIGEYLTTPDVATMFGVHRKRAAELLWNCTDLVRPLRARNDAIAWTRYRREPRKPFPVNKSDVRNAPRSAGGSR